MMKFELLTFFVICFVLCNAQQCPSGANWVFHSELNLCYGYLSDQLDYAAAQKACNNQNANLWQMDTSQGTDKLDEALIFLQENGLVNAASVWIGLTDIEQSLSYKWLNKIGFAGGRTNVRCPNSDNVNICKPASRCVFMKLEKSNPRLLFSGVCSDRYYPFCYAPPGGTKNFDAIPTKSGVNLNSITWLWLSAIICWSLIVHM